MVTKKGVKSKVVKNVVKPKAKAVKKVVKPKAKAVKKVATLKVAEEPKKREKPESKVAKKTVAERPKAYTVRNHIKVQTAEGWKRSMQKKRLGNNFKGSRGKI